MGKSLFLKPKYKKYGKIVSFKNKTKALDSSKALKKEYRQSKTKAKKLRVARVAQYSANRSKASAKRKNLKPQTKKEYREIGKIYDQTAKELWDKYDKNK